MIWVCGFHDLLVGEGEGDLNHNKGVCDYYS
jgi:hypothetical protein